MKLRIILVAVPVVLVLGVFLVDGRHQSRAADPAEASSVHDAPRVSSSHTSAPVHAVPRGPKPITEEATAPLVDGPSGDSETTTPRDIAASVRAGRMAGAWTDVRKVLMASSDPEDQALADEVYAVVLALREQRRAPDPSTWRELEDVMDGLAEDVEARGHATAEGLERAHALRGL